MSINSNNRTLSRRRRVNDSSNKNVKNTGYSISINRTIEERNSYKALLNQKKKLAKEEMLGEWEFKIRGPPWDQKIIKTKKKQC